jgi:hypothetical protein
MGWIVWGLNPSSDKGFPPHSALTFSGADTGSYPVVTGALFPKVLSSQSMRLTTHPYLLSWPRMSGIYTFTPMIHLQCGQSFIFCYEGGRWREFIVAAAAAISRCIWNVTALRMLWMFYEKYRRLKNMCHCISLLIAVFLSAET